MPLHTVSTLSIKIGLAEGRIINILKYEYKLEGALRTDSPIPEAIANAIIKYYDIQNNNSQAQSFENFYLKDKEKTWNNPVIKAKRFNYTPGTISEGEVYQIDNERKLIKVKFKEINHEEGFFFTKIVIDRPSRKGIVSFDEWDWELIYKLDNLPKIGSHHDFLILQNNPDNDLILSRRQAIDSPEPQYGIGQIVRHHNDKQFVCVRTTNGGYGFIAYKDLMPFDSKDGEMVNLQLIKKYKETFGNHTFYFAQYGIEDSHSEERETYYRNMSGLNKFERNDIEDLFGVNSEENFVKRYHDGQPLLSKITGRNDGGYLLKSIGQEKFRLFCPSSQSPTWIDKSINDKVIGLKWLVKIISDPEEGGNNTVVSAKFEKKDYDGILEHDGYYKAIVCSCNDKGANVLIEEMVPLFIPNKYISWKKNNDAQKDLTPGKTCIIKVIKNENGVIASIRDTMVAPWLCVKERLPIGRVVETSILKREERYILVDLGEYIGFLPAKEISWTKFTPDCRETDLPDSLRVVITNYDEEHKTVNVSLRKVIQDPWERIDSHISIGDKVTATIMDLTISGAKLNVGNLEFKGYLSYRDVDWCKYIDKDSFPYAVGKQISVMVTHVNKERRQITCSLKELVANPWEELDGKDTVDGLVGKVYDNHADVLIDGGIECTCNESLDSNYKGQKLSFEILHLNVAAQQISISLRKKEIEQLNVFAIGEMFKEYRNLSAADKELSTVTNNEGEAEVYRDFTIKEVSSTGRVTAVYAKEDDEYENGILLPGSIKIKGNPVHVIFARQIIKQHVLPGDTLKFRITHKYKEFNYAVLELDATDLLELDTIALDDMTSLTSIHGVEATVLHNMNTVRNIFVVWKGYFGYIPRIEFTITDDNIPETLRVKAIIAPKHPGQMIRFTTVDKEEEEEKEQELEAEKEVAANLDAELLDCYNEINRRKEFNPQLPDYYPYGLQIRYDPEKHKELKELLTADQTYFSSQTFFLDCVRNKNGGYWLTVFNTTISITAFCHEKEEDYEIQITKCNLNVVESSEMSRHYGGRPLRISGEHLQIIPSNSSALPPAQQDADLIMAFLTYNREVLPKLRELSRDGMQKRGEHYLTLQELLKMDLEREVSLCSKDVKIRTLLKEDAGSLGGTGLIFEATVDAFNEIMSNDDPEEGLKVLLKPDDNEPFKDHKPSGILKYLGSDQWIIELFPNRDFDFEVLKEQGLQIKRYPNIRHLNKQIWAIDNFVYERNGLDIFSKIARNKLKPVVFPPIEDIEANPHFHLQDPTDSQANALKMALGGSQITLIQGPPGTGKSTVIVDIIRNLVKKHKKVLVCTQSVAPVEELYYKLSGRRSDKVVGEPVKVDGHALRCAYLRDDESLEISGSVEELRKAIKDMRSLVENLHSVNSSANESSIADLKTLETHHKEESNEVIRKFEKDISPQSNDVLHILEEYYDALDKEDVKNFSSEHRSLNMEAVDVVFGTCIGVGVNPYLRELHFDTLIIDEAGKANYAESLVPMMMADEYILVGDNKQLPPYTNSELLEELAARKLENDKSESEAESDASAPRTLEAVKGCIMEAVGKSLFGDLKSRLPESNQIMLSKQFRMHPEIGDFVSKLFYDGKVMSVPKAEERTINIAGLERAIKFIDTSGMGSKARESRQGGMSLYNEGEIQVIEQQLLPMLESALESGRTVGVLSPYRAQVMRMRERFPKLKRHIFTIDSIQGEEYDIVVFSFVRNTQSGSLNFIDDLRRLNVSFSRAKCNLIMVGHLDTLKNKSLHKVDQDAVMAVINEIENKKVEVVAHHGAMQQLYDDFPPESCCLINNLDCPYHVFEDCRPTKNGQFTSLYKGSLLTLYNPVLHGIPKEERLERFRASLIGYKDGKPHTMIEPIGFWLSKQTTLKNFKLSAIVNRWEPFNLTLEMSDKTLIALSIPSSPSFIQGTKVKIEVCNNSKFTVKPIENE